MKILVEEHNSKNIHKRKNFNNSFLGSYRDIENETIDEMVIISLNKIGFNLYGSSSDQADIDFFNHLYQIAIKHDKKIMTKNLKNNAFVNTGEGWTQSYNLFIYAPFSHEFVEEISPFFNKQAMNCFNSRRNISSYILKNIEKESMSSLSEKEFTKN